MAYPETERLKDLLSKEPYSRPENEHLVNAALAYVGEYEHGSVDIEDLIDPEAKYEGHDAVYLLASIVRDFVQVAVHTKEL